MTLLLQTTQAEENIAGDHGRLSLKHNAALLAVANNMLLACVFFKLSIYTLKTFSRSSVCLLGPIPVNLQSILLKLSI